MKPESYPNQKTKIENGYKYNYLTYPEKYTKKYFEREYDMCYKTNACGRTRKIWARDQAFDDYVRRNL
jgi:hypothetical protein